MELLIDRMVRAVKLDESLYWELRRDPRVQTQVLMVVFILGLVSAFGRIPLSFAFWRALSAETLLSAVMFAIVGTVIWWLALSFIYYWVGTRYLQGYGNFQSMAYAMAFALVPSLLQIFLFVIPALGWIGGIIISLWLFLSQSTAVRQTLGLNPMHAFIMVFGTTFLLRIIGGAVFPMFMTSFMRVI